MCNAAVPAMHMGHSRFLREGGGTDARPGALLRRRGPRCGPQRHGQERGGYRAMHRFRLGLLNPGSQHDWGE